MKVLTEYEVPSFDCFFVYPEELRDSARVTVFRDFLIANARRWNFWSDARLQTGLRRRSIRYQIPRTTRSRGLPRSRPCRGRSSAKLSTASMRMTYLAFL